jgi:uncharacterized protein (TIGR02453 family)
VWHTGTGVVQRRYRGRHARPDGYEEVGTVSAEPATAVRAAGLACVAVPDLPEDLEFRLTADGIPFAALDFYEELEADNSKAFWTAHKHVYEESVKAPILALVAALEPEFGPAKVFRPYRDVRFAKDKTPYKTHQGAWFGESHRYLQVSAAGLMLGGGRWQLSPEQLAGFRRAVDDERHGPTLEKAVGKVRRAGFELHGDVMTRVPSGFAKDHPRAELLRYRTLTGHLDVGAPDWLPTSDAASEIAARWRKLTPLVEWLESHAG